MSRDGSPPPNQQLTAKLPHSVFTSLTDELEALIEEPFEASSSIVAERYSSNGVPVTCGSSAIATAAAANITTTFRERGAIIRARFAVIKLDH